MKFEKFSSILLCLTALFLKDVMTGIPYSDHERYEKLCSKYDHMMESGMSKEELEKLFENEMEFDINDALKKQNLDTFSKRGNSWYFNSADSDVIVQSRDQIGEYGQLVRDVNVGTGESTGQYDSPLSLNQINHHIDQSEFKLILATIEASISASKKKKPAKSDKINRSSNQLDRNVRKSCRDMIKSTYERLWKRIGLRRNTQSKGSKLTSEKNMVSSGRGGPNFEEEEGGNSTLIDNQASIGPNGYAANIINVATGQASNSADRHLYDFQSHGKYQESDVDILKLTLGIPISLKKAKFRARIKKDVQKSS
ncbi:uncharacterized protein LOC141852598 [Brevipalpus obovatus]|uniref:uncharacterized protein LOC141852598 n=1 Tax=Brevipalpus obovatus TaxID=246614 RepID=UPI003D9E3B39